MVTRIAASMVLIVLSTTARPASACTGDCDGGGSITIEELIQGVGIALGSGALDGCSAFDANDDDRVTIEELIAAVDAALNGCPQPTATAELPTATAELPTATPPPDSPTAELPSATPTPTSGPFLPFCNLPGSLQFTDAGQVLVPGGPEDAPSLAFLNLPVGFCVHYYARVADVRQLRFAPGGELFAASPTTLTTGGDYQNGLEAIVVLPDDDLDGTADTTITFLSGLPSTQGMLFANGYFYYQDRTKIMRLPYAAGDRAPAGAGEEVVNIGTNTGYYQSRLHWPKVLDIADDGTIYVTNGGEQGGCAQGGAISGDIVAVDGTPGGKPIARGFRNPIALRCARGFNRCFAIELAQDYTDAVGGREKLVPVREGDDWGHPCCATANQPYPNISPTPDCSDVAAEPGSFIVGHTPFDLDFETGRWPPPWNNRVYVPMHGAYGTWVGERVVSFATDPVTGDVIMGSELPAQDSGSLLDFATGWDDGPAPQGPHGRPANVAFAPDGRLFLGNDNTGDIIWIAPMGM